MGRDATDAFAKSQIAAGVVPPTEGTVFVSMADVDKEGVVESVQRLVAVGFKVLATSGTARYLSGLGVECERVNKVRDGKPDVIDAMKSGRIKVVFNSTIGLAAVRDSAAIRQAALKHQIPYFTTVSAADAISCAIERLAEDRPLEVCSLQEHLEMVSASRA